MAGGEQRRLRRFGSLVGAKVSLPVDEPTPERSPRPDSSSDQASSLHPPKYAVIRKSAAGDVYQSTKSEPPAAKAEGSGKLCWPGYAPWGPRGARATLENGQPITIRRPFRCNTRAPARPGPVWGPITSTSEWLRRARVADGRQRDGSETGGRGYRSPSGPYV